jgi:hypothetical protein
MLMTEWNMEDALRIRAEEAKEEGIEETARKMIREAIPLDIIAKITGFDFQRLLRLQKSV